MPVFELEGADGGTYEVEAPDARSAVAALRKMQGQDAPAGEGRGTLGDMLYQGGEGLRRGLYSTFNAPTAIANAAMGLTPSEFRFKRPLEAAAPGIDEMYMSDTPADTPAGEVMDKVGEYVGGDAPLLATGIGAAPALAARTARATSTGGKLVNQTAGAIARNPGKVAAGETVSATGAGLGASIGESINPDSPNAELAGAMAGGLLFPSALSAATGGVTRKIAGAARERFSPDEVGRRQREAITTEIRENMTPDGYARIAESAELQKAIPGYRPSVAEATESPSFIATQRVFEGDLSGPDLDRAINRYGENEAAIEAARQAQAPQSRVGIDEAFDAGRQRIGGITKRLETADDFLGDSARRTAARLQSDQQPRERGAGIREELIAARGNIKEEMAITADEMGLNDPAARFPFDKVKDDLISSVEPRSKLADRSALPSGILRDIEAMDHNASIVDLMELRSRISSDIREARRTPTGEKRVPYLERLKSEVDSATERLISSVDDPGLSDRLKEFRRIYREDYIQPFEQGAASRALKTDAAGGYVVPDEKVAKQFFDGWTQTAAEQFKKVFKDSAGAGAAMEGAALDDLHTFATRDGILNPGLVEAWKRKNRAVLQSFPNIGSKVDSVQDAVRGIAERRAQIAARRSRVEQSVLARELGRLDSATATPETVLDAAIKNPSRMQKIMKGVKAPEAKDAIARYAWERALSDKNPAEFLKRNGLSLSPAMGKEKYEAAKRLARAMEKNNLVPRPAGQPIDTNPVGWVESKLGTGLNQISSRVFAVKSGRTSARYAAADIAGRAFRNMTGRQAQELLQSALYDPQVAKDLALAIEAPQMVGEAAVKRIYTFALSNGILAATPDSDQ